MKFNNSPISEAVLEIRFRKLDDSFLPTIEKIGKKLSDVYPQKRVINTGSFTFNVLKNPKLNSSKTFQLGYRYDSTDKLDVAQLKLDSITISRLKPYLEWKDLKRKSKKIINLFLKEIKIEEFTRIGLRFINKFEFNFPLDLDNFFNFQTNRPKILEPCELVDFLLRFGYREPNHNINANIIFTHNAIPKKSSTGILLDLDIINKKLISNDSVKLWKEFDIARDFADEIFFDIITDKTRNLLK